MNQRYSDVQNAFDLVGIICGRAAKRTKRPSLSEPTIRVVFNISDVVSCLAGTPGDVQSPPWCEENLAEMREGR